MTEHLHVQSPEQEPETIEVHAIHHEAPDQATVEKQAEQMQETARAAIHETAGNMAPLALPVDDKPQDNQPLYIDKTVKKLRMKQSLSQVQRELTPMERGLSKLIHQPAVRAVSEVGAKTVSRPSGLLGGGLLAFLGSSTYLFMTKYIGFRYNYLVFLLLFVGGFVLGLVLELLVRLVRPRPAE
jgi:hypothetical protein